MRVLLLGATGLVGSELLEVLLADESFATVRIAVRRSTGRTHSKLDEHVFDLAKMNAHAGAFAVDTIFCALGTTIKKAGSQDAFRGVDYDLPLEAARLGLQYGASQYLIVSSIGADPESRNFYLRVKGEVERDISSLGYRSVTIARPSLLLGPRKEWRLGEQLAKPFGWLMPPKYRPIEARDVARALVASARSNEPGVHVLESRAMRSRRA